MKSAIALATIVVMTLAACAPPQGPRARPGLWRQTITLSGTDLDPADPPPPVASHICVGPTGFIHLPYYRAHSSRDCDEDVFQRQDDGVWTSRTVCRHPQLGQMTVNANVWGDFRLAYGITGQVEIEGGSVTNATVVGQWQGECPITMAPGEEISVER